MAGTDPREQGGASRDDEKGSEGPAAAASRQHPRPPRALLLTHCLLLACATHTLACKAPRPRLPDIFLAQKEAAEAREREGSLPRRVEREVRHPATDELRHTWTEWRVPGELAVRDGLEMLYHEGGARKAERHWDKGQQVGVWQSWFAEGALESRVEFAGAGIEAPMRWFHPSGQLAAEGLGVQGVRSGAWTYWYPNGQKRQAGRFIGGQKESEWSFWTEDGQLEARGNFRQGRRIGEWLRPGRQEE